MSAVVDTALPTIGEDGSTRTEPVLRVRHCQVAG
jgi:hypothetical protein